MIHLSQMACSFVFIPPIVRPVRRPSSQLSRLDWTPCDESSNRWHRSSPGSSHHNRRPAHHHLSKDTFVTPPLRSVIERLLRSVCLRRIAPTQAISIDKIVQLNAGLSYIPGLPWASEAQSSGALSTLHLTRRAQKCSPLVLHHEPRHFPKIGS